MNSPWRYFMNLNHKIASCLFAFVCLIAAGYPVSAGSGKNLTPSLSKHAGEIDRLVDGKKTKDGREYLEQMLRSAGKYDEYIYSCHQTTRKKDRTVSGTAKFYFKKNNRMRLDVTSGGGVKKGSVVVRRKDGKIRAHGGSTLRFLKMTLQPDSRLLMLPNGFNVARSDFRTLIGDLRQKASKGSHTAVTVAPVWDKAHGDKYHILDVSKPGSRADNLHYRILVDPQTQLPVEWNCYTKGSLYSITRFKEFHPNPGLKDNLFEM